MNRFKSFFRALPLAAVVLSAGLWSCADNDEPAFVLYYADVADIGPSMTFQSGAPSYYGGVPTDFTITAVKLDGTLIESNSFVINNSTGALSIENTATLAVGNYAVSVACKVGGQSYNFADVIKVAMLPATPSGLKAVPEVVTIVYGDVESAEQGSQLSFEGESVSVVRYEIVQAEDKAYFAVNTSGLIALSTTFEGDVPPGEYPLKVRVVTHAGSADYSDVVTFKITSKPLSLTYTPSSAKMEIGTTVASTVPEMKGSTNGLQFAIKQITPSTEHITIDAATGALSVAAANNFAVGDSYAVDVTVTNEFGSTDFEAAFTVLVVAYISPIASLSYAAITQVQGGAVAVDKNSDFVGDEVTFSLVDLPQALEGQISIDAMTGAITAPKGNAIPVGTYNIKVKAENIKGSVEATLALTIETNPYYFTKIHYGNNLSLTPTTDYADQFRYTSAVEMTAAPLTPSTDMGAGITAEWSVKILHQMSGTTIDAATGALTLAGYKGGNGGCILVTATTGKDTAGETSVTVPVFFNFPTQTALGLTVAYTPFVFKCNPRTGGTSAPLTVDGLDAGGAFSIDYRRTFSYYNLGGPATHISGELNNKNNTIANSDLFLGQLWQVYYSNATVNYGAKNPVSYFANRENLSLPLCYVDATASNAVRVNPNKWVDASGNYANGIFIGQMTYVKDAAATNINNGDQQFPLFIWFDEKF